VKLFMTTILDARRRHCEKKSQHRWAWPHRTVHQHE